MHKKYTPSCSFPLYLYGNADAGKESTPPCPRGKEFDQHLGRIVPFSYRSNPNIPDSIKPNTAVDNGLCFVVIIFFLYS
jgi:hypothetical protein